MLVLVAAACLAQRDKRDKSNEFIWGRPFNEVATLVWIHGSMDPAFDFKLELTSPGKRIICETNVELHKYLGKSVRVSGRAYVEDVSKLSPRRRARITELEYVIDDCRVAVVRGTNK